MMRKIEPLREELFKKWQKNYRVNTDLKQPHDLVAAEVELREIQHEK